MRPHNLHLASVLCSIVIFAGCSTLSDTQMETSPASQERTESVEKPASDIPLPTYHSIVDAPTCSDAVGLHSDDPIRQISWMMTDADTTDVEFRHRRGLDEQWTPWNPVEITFVEGDAYNARIIFDAPAHEVEIRGGEAIFDAYFSIQPYAPARSNPIDVKSAAHPENSARCSHADTYLVAASEDGTVGPELPDELVTSRRHWNAIAPDRVCRKIADPYRITFHHTFLPGVDAGDTAKTVRQIQSYHLNERGWCDIGYHFLVGPHGQIFEGSTAPHRLAAHVGDHNEGNIGIALLGDFSTDEPTGHQLDAAIRLTDWLHRHYDIELDRNAIRGHGEWPGQTTACPGDGADRFIDDVIEATGQPGEHRVDHRPESDLRGL